ncbi:hydroquinone glucosyltransferase-like [Andrographis paniculata]|uniref:hydroquinone glucosyltransferase-like n=1 Tax=Andrographis paniculata TaxID=175694 RepID=UPI0021E94EBC|nr:hydroquinone glucosyltransferase-like [Andrographis paniculata]
MDAHIALLPSPGMGHLIPIVEFARTLHRRHAISATLILPTDGPLSPAQSSFLSTLPPSVRCLLLPPVALHDLPPDVKIETRISLTITRSMPSIRDALASSSPAALVVDLFGTDAFQAAVDLRIPPYIFFPSTAMLLSLFLYLPTLDEAVSCEYAQVPEKLRIPGCVPIHGRDLLDPLQDRGNDAYKWVLHHARRYRMAHGIILNTFRELEPGAVEALLLKKKKKKKDNSCSIPAVYPIGPLIQTPDQHQEGASFLKWLDEQPGGSVLYVSFGSGGTLSHAQMIELALGLELSEQRFLWVVRRPNSNISNASYFNSNNSDDPRAYLPEGFEERTRKQGVVVPLWAPQAQILGHEATGGFLTHCGWNSTLESVVNGVPMIAWPLYAEQRMNAVMLVEEVKVALRPREDGDGVVGRAEVARAVKGLMEGEEGKGIKNRMRALKNAAATAVAVAVGGERVDGGGDGDGDGDGRSNDNNDNDDNNNMKNDGGESTKFLAELVAQWRKSDDAAATVSHLSV